jgi:acyl-coenzyme A synthetase/AMP-(fatty) acid ligase/aryl carrier-like protein
VAAPQAAVAGYFDFLRRGYGLSPDDGVLQLAPVTFDASVRDLLGPLAAGARVVLPGAEEARDPALLLRRAAEEAVTCLLSVVPSLLRGLLSAADGGGPRLRALRLVLSSGEALPAAEAAALGRTIAPAAALYNQYGATECTMSSVRHRFDPRREPDGTVPVGRPIDGMRLHVLDRRLRLLPPGAAGEVYLGGRGLSWGYVGDPRLTAERFLPDPFAGTPGERLYRLGDRGAFDPRGALRFLGRIDRQVQVRGYRVEPEEVETALATHPALTEVAVVDRELATGERGLVAYAAAAGDAPSTAELHRFASERLPAYMVPAAFVLIPSLPRNRHGKVDRAALPPPGSARPRLDVGRIAPRDDAERRLAAIWREVLGLDEVGIHDNFFAIGGHSLRAMQVVSRLRRDAGVELPLAAVFQQPTIAALAARMAAADAGGTPAQIRPVARAARRALRTEVG